VTIKSAFASGFVTVGQSFAFAYHLRF